MATVYKRGGRNQRGGRYYISYFDHNGQRVSRSARTTDKATAERIAAKLEADAALRRDGVIDPREDRFATEDRRALAEHVADFQSVLFSKGNNADYVNQAVARVKHVLSQCQADRIGRLTSSAVQAAIGRLRASGKSLATCNGYLRSIKGFTAWLHRDRRLREDPLRTLSTFNEAIDRRHVRREPTVAELTWLIETTKRRTHENHSLPGPDRAMLYLLGVGTGLRASELRSLHKESFELDQDPPVVRVAAAYSKRRRDDVQPISGELAKIAKAWLANKTSGEILFGAMPGDTARMLRKDLAAARTAWIAAATDEAERRERSDSDFLRYRNSAGAVLDFHSLRHAFISAVVNSGASVKVAQELARHGSPTLTIGRYSHVRLQDLRGALEAVPVVSGSVGWRRLDVGRPENILSTATYGQHEDGVALDREDSAMASS